MKNSSLSEINKERQIEGSHLNSKRNYYETEGRRCEDGIIHVIGRDKNKILMRKIPLGNKSELERSLENIYEQRQNPPK